MTETGKRCDWLDTTRWLFAVFYLLPPQNSELMAFYDQGKTPREAFDAALAEREAERIIQTEKGA